MNDRYNVEVKVISQKGTCARGHKEGDCWIISSKTPDGICMAAFNVIFPDLRTLSFGGEFPWAKDKDTSVVACPDAENPVVFKLKRLR